MSFPDQFKIPKLAADPQNIAPSPLNFTLLFKFNVLSAVNPPSTICNVATGVVVPTPNLENEPDKPTTLPVAIIFPSVTITLALIAPVTVNGFVGAAVPIPTLPPVSILIRSPVDPCSFITKSQLTPACVGLNAQPLFGYAAFFIPKNKFSAALFAKLEIFPKTP